MLNSLREDEQFILQNSAEPESLLDVTRKQYVNRRLTNISDEIFSFFIHLSDQCLKLLSDENFHKYGDNTFEFCKQKIIENTKLFETFSTVLETHSIDKQNEFSEKQVCVDRQAIVRILYQKIIKIYLLVLFGQFRKDILDVFKITKKMAIGSKFRYPNQVLKQQKKNKKQQQQQKKKKKQKKTPMLFKM